jgi:hypothetical protein
MAEVFKIGVEIALAGTIVQGLEAISGRLLGIDRQVKLIGAGFRTWGAVLGGLSIAGGAGILGGLKAIADHGEKLIHQQNAIYRATKDWQGVVDLTGAAYDGITRAVPTAAAHDVLRAYNELRTVVGDRALASTPMSLKMESVLGNLTGKDAEGEGYKLWRALEMKGITISNPELANKLAVMMVQAIAGSGGKVDAGTFQQLARRGGAAWIGATPEAIGPYSVAAADLGGDGAGTALMTLRQLLTGAVSISRQQLDVLQQAGLIDMSKVKKVPGSNTMQVAPGAITGSAEGQNNIYGWMQLIAPTLHKLAESMAAKSGDKPEAVYDSLLAKLGRNRNAIKMMTMFSDPGFVEQINKDLSIWGQGMNLDNAYAAMLGRPGSDVRGPGGLRSEAASERAGADVSKRADYGATMGALAKQWESLMEAVGGPVARAAIPIIGQFTDLFNSLGAMANRNPETIAIIAKAAAAIGVMMITLGGAAVVGAAATILGPVAAGVVGIGSIMATLAALNFGAVQSGLQSVQAAFNSFIAQIQGVAGQIKSAVAALVAALMAIPNAIAGVASSIGGAISHMNPFGGGGGGGDSGPHPRGSSYFNPHGDGPSLQPPTLGKQSMNSTGHVYIDGAKVGSVMWGRSGQFPRSASAFDPHGSFVGPDFAMTA